MFGDCTPAEVPALSRRVCANHQQIWTGVEPLMACACGKKEYRPLAQRRAKPTHPHPRQDTGRCSIKSCKAQKPA